MLDYLRLKNVGPAADMELDLAPRLNLITGDNGLGKTLLLDTAWFVLTHTWPFSWPGKGVVPTADDAELAWGVNGLEARASATFDHAEANWRPRRKHEGDKPYEQPAALVVYARVDGGFSVSDPVRVGHDFRLPFGKAALGTTSCFQFEPADAWDGLEVERNGTKTRVSEGLLRDWRSWAQDPADPSFGRFARVVGALAAGEDIVPLKAWRRVFVDDARDIPLLRTPSGDVPVVHAPASMKRILALAYIVVWAWREHRIAAELQKQEPLDSIVLLFDELEAHLHPQWQRRIAPALMELAAALDSEARLQAILTTHSPLVLASLEPWFDEEQDRVFHLGIDEGRAWLREVPWAKQGDATNWLVSETFGLRQGRSVEAERAIEAAEAWMRADSAALPPNLTTKDEIHAELLRVLAGHDPFWPRWVVWVESKEPKT